MQQFYIYLYCISLCLFSWICKHCFYTLEPTPKEEEEDETNNRCLCLLSRRLAIFKFSVIFFHFLTYFVIFILLTDFIIILFYWCLLLTDVLSVIRLCCQAKLGGLLGGGRRCWRAFWHAKPTVLPSLFHLLICFLHCFSLFYMFWFAKPTSLRR